MNEYEAAQKYISLGWVIHPLSRPDDKGNSPGKRPLLAGWQTLTQTPDDIDKYIKDGCNVGLVCGKTSGVMVLDFDHELFKDDIFHEIELNTLMSGRTNGRGHVFFKYHPMLTASKHHDLGIEVLSNGNNAVLPPSVHNSGMIYKWKNPDAPIMEMPEEVLKRLNILFRTETELKQIISKCRHCFRDVIKRKPDMHGAEGREYMLAVCTDIKAVKDKVGNKSANADHIRMFAKIMYGTDYDETRTLQEWSNIDASKTWKCQTLMAKLPTYIDPEKCKKCDERNKTISKKDYKTNGAFDYIDRITEKTPVYYDNAGQFWLWNIDGYYKQVDNTEILLTLLKDIADPAIIQATFKAELLEAARLRGRDARVKEVPNNWIYLQNGVYDVKTGELSEPTPEYLFTAPIPHKISNSENTPIIDKLFSEWVAPEKIFLLNEIAAYCLYNGYPIHRMFVLIGRGRNGKGQYRDFVVNLVGHNNRTASTLEQLINSRFETARLFNKKICTMGEINYTLLDRTAILKMLSGGDPIPGEIKNKSPFDFVNTAKLIINTNSLPQTSDKTDAFYSRCVMVEFGRQFQLGKDIIETIPPEEYDNFLTKSLRVLRELLNRGEFTNEGDIQAKEREYERLSNPLTQFINLYYEPDINSKVAAWRLMDEYVAYCTEKGFKKPSSKNEFNNMLKINYDVEKKNCIDEEDGLNKCWVWIFGIKRRNYPFYPNYPVSHSIPLQGYPSEDMDKIDKTDNTDNGRLDENLSQSTIYVLTKMDKKQGETNNIPVTQKLPVTQFKDVGGSVPVTQFKDFGLRAKDWMCYNSKSITNETLIEVSMWIAESLKNVNPSDVKSYLEREYKLTPQTTAALE